VTKTLINTKNFTFVNMVWSDGGKSIPLNAWIMSWNKPKGQAHPQKARPKIAKTTKRTPRGYQGTALSLMKNESVRNGSDTDEYGYEAYKKGTTTA
jgi:hypothetical protein